MQSTEAYIIILYQCCELEKVHDTSRPQQDGCQSADHILKYIFLNENVCILIEMSLNFVPKGSVDNMSALIQVGACHM